VGVLIIIFINNNIMHVQYTRFPLVPRCAPFAVSAQGDRHVFGWLFFVLFLVFKKHSTAGDNGETEEELSVGDRKNFSRQFVVVSFHETIAKIRTAPSWCGFLFLYGFPNNEKFLVSFDLLKPILI